MGALESYYRKVEKPAAVVSGATTTNWVAVLTLSIPQLRRYSLWLWNTSANTLDYRVRMSGVTGGTSIITTGNLVSTGNATFFGNWNYDVGSMIVDVKDNTLNQAGTYNIDYMGKYV